MKHFVYIVKCSDDTLYTGYSIDIEKRIKLHNSGKGAKYTRCRQPVKLVYWEKYDSKGKALSREYAIKKMKRDDKIKLMLNPKIC